MPRQKQRRWTPWDLEKRDALRAILSPHSESVTPPEPTKPRSGRMVVFRLHGRYVFDPARVTSEDVRQFMWSGLRFLRSQAKARGLSEEQVQDMLMSAFNAFHDTAESVWTTLKTVVSKKIPVSLSNVEVPLPVDPFVACEEDRPVLVKMCFKKPLTPLDPDAEMLASFEP